MRKTFDELRALEKQFNTDRLWSWSRVNSVHNSLYEYYLKYIRHIAEDRQDSIYTVTGGISHDIIEKFYKGDITYEQMIEEFEDGWTTAMIAELKFNRSDAAKNATIGDKYYCDLQHFFKNHKKIKTKVLLEHFVTIKIGDEYYQGYIDCLTKDEDGVYHIIDWKTSTAYTGAKAENECGQLVLYSMALHQLGVPYDKIKICWNFLKYQNITIMMKNGTTKVRQIERAKIGESLQANAKMWLKELGYEDDLMEYLDALAQSNDIQVLPKDVQEKYICEDCYVYVDLTDALLKRWEDYIIETTRMIRNKEAEYKRLKSTGQFDDAEKLWWEDEESVKAQSYYFANLCSYSAKLHKPYAAYLEKDAEKNDNLLGGKKSNDEYAEDDLSWLNEL